MKKSYNESVVRSTLRLIAEKYAENPVHFNMNSYGEKTQCGTAMCFAGWGLLDAGAIKWTKTEGFHSGDEAEWGALLNAKGKQLAVRLLKDRYPSTPNPVATEDDFFIAGQKLFGLTEDEALYLFHEFQLKTPKQLAERLSEVLGEDPEYFLNEVTG